jgi:hypothetical protein
MLNGMAIRIRRRAKPEPTNVVLGTYAFPSRTVKVVLTEGERIRWICDCEEFGRWTAFRDPPWCKHIAKAAARRSIERLARRVAIPRTNEQ